MLRDASTANQPMWCSAESESGYEAKCSKLHRTLKQIVKARGALDAQEAAALREAERLRVWRHFGYGSLIEYMEMEMGYAPRAALERLRVAKAIVELPAIADAMAQGDLSFSAGRELTRVATPDTEAEWLEAANDKNVRQVENLVSGHKRGERPTDPADPALRKRVLRYEVSEETVALTRQAKQILEREYGERLDDDALQRIYARMVIDGAAAPERTRPPHVMATTICEQCKRGWLDAGGVTVEMAPATLEAALCDAQHIGSLHGDSGCGGADSEQANQRCGNAADLAAGSSAVDPKRANEPCGNAAELAAGNEVARPEKRGAKQVARAKSDIPPALRRKVKHRDHGRCRVPWCRSSRNCDQHHIVPLAKGGAHTEENIITLCESHHIASHAGALLIEGDARNATFTRRVHHALATAERVVETTRALKALGFDRSEVKQAVEKTRTHVGTAELTLEQWIKIALGYCPKPTTN